MVLTMFCINVLLRYDYLSDYETKEIKLGLNTYDHAKVFYNLDNNSQKFKTLSDNYKYLVEIYGGNVTQFQNKNISLGMFSKNKNFYIILIFFNIYF